MIPNVVLSVSLSISLSVEMSVSQSVSRCVRWSAEKNLNEGNVLMYYLAHTLQVSLILNLSILK